MRRTSMLASILAVVFFGAVNGAMAQGNSATDQYIENIPDARGDVETGGGSSGGGGSDGDSGGGDSGGSVPKETIDELEQAGGDGAAAAALAQETAPGAGGDEGANTAPGSRGDEGAKPDRDGTQLDLSQFGASGDDGSSAAAGDVSGSDRDSGGIGPAFPIIFGVCLVAILILLARRRLSGEPGPA